MVTTLIWNQGNHEDPCIWRDHRGHFHALFHFGASHAYSADGLTWHWGSDDAWDVNAMNRTPHKLPIVCMRMMVQRNRLMVVSDATC